MNAQILPKHKQYIIYIYIYVRMNITKLNIIAQCIEIPLLYTEVYTYIYVKMHTNGNATSKYVFTL